MRESCYSARMRAGILCTVTVLVCAASWPRAAPATVELVARDIQPGEVVLLTLKVAPTVSAVHVTAFGHAQPVFRISPWRMRTVIASQCCWETDRADLQLRRAVRFSLEAAQTQSRSRISTATANRIW